MRSSTHWFGKLALAGGLLLVGCGVLQAHPGHALEIVPSDASLHYLLQPEHLGGVLLLAAAVAWSVIKMWRQRPRMKRAVVRLRK